MSFFVHQGDIPAWPIVQELRIPPVPRKARVTLHRCEVRFFGPREKQVGCEPGKDVQEMRTFVLPQITGLQLAVFQAVDSNIHNNGESK